MPEPSSSSRVFPVLAVGGAGRARATEPVCSVSASEAPQRVDSRLALMVDPSSERADAFRFLRHRLLQRQDPHILAVTSAAASEGKTTVAANLALAIAEEHSSSVVLLDAHRARPALANLFAIAPEDCLRAAVGGRQYQLCAVEGTSLHVGLALGAEGPLSPGDRDALRVALTDIRLSYDYVVIDTGAALSGIDVPWIAELVDGVIFAVRRTMTDRRSLRRALSRLAPAPLAGAVLLDA